MKSLSEDIRFYQRIDKKGIYGLVATEPGENHLIEIEATYTGPVPSNITTRKREGLVAATSKNKGYIDRLEETVKRTKK